MPLVGSILVLGRSHVALAFPCDRCTTLVTHTWTIRCAFALCERQHSICANCLSEIHRFACASPAAAELRLTAAAERCRPKT